MLDASHKRGIVNIGVNLKQLDFNDGEVIVEASFENQIGIADLLKK